MVDELGGVCDVAFFELCDLRSLQRRTAALEQALLEQCGSRGRFTVFGLDQRCCSGLRTEEEVRQGFSETKACSEFVRCYQSLAEKKVRLIHLELLHFLMRPSRPPSPGLSSSNSSTSGVGFALMPSAAQGLRAAFVRELSLAGFPVVPSSLRELVWAIQRQEKRSASAALKTVTAQLVAERCERNSVPREERLFNWAVLEARVRAKYHPAKAIG